MVKHSTIVKRAGVLTTALLAISCSESVGPERGSPGAPSFSFSPNGITLNTDNGALGYSGRVIRKGFDRGNPHNGDAIVATFYWIGSTNTVTSVRDVLTDATFTPAGNTYHLVQYVQAGGISMATYVATNIHFDSTPGYRLAVEANFSDSIPDGGVKMTAWTGVEDVFANALGSFGSDSVSASTPTPLAPGPVTIRAGSVAYGVSLSNGGVNIASRPAGWNNIGGGIGSDGRLQDDGDYLPPSGGGTIDPQWTWDFQHQSTALATVLELRPGTSGPANQPPVAAFTSSCSGLACGFTSTSSDPDGSIASYSWTFGDGGTSTLQNPSHSYAAGGTYTVTLTVTDNQGASNAVSHTVTVNAANQPPTANFTSSCSGLTCSFTSASTDPDGSISAYSWTFGDGATSTVQNPSHTYAAGGTYTVTLRVTDNQGAQSTTTSKSVTVAAANQPPVASFTKSCSGLTCSFTSTSSDPDGSIASYSWTFGDGGTSTLQNPSRTYAAGGTYTVTLKVTDNRGAWTATSQTVTVTAPNQAPVVNAGPDQTVLTGLLFTLNASFTDPDNGPWTYRIDWGDGSSTTGSLSAPGTISKGHTYVTILPRNFTIRVTVTDSRGVSGSDTKVVYVVLL